MTQRVVNYTYGTGNPVLPDGSIDVRDGIDNLQSLDVFMNATEDTYNQRDGEIVQTVAGAIRSTGFKPGTGDFTTGFTVMPGERDIAWYDPVSLNWYSYIGVIPTGGHDVSPGTNPVGDPLWKQVTDILLRNELSSTGGVQRVNGAFRVFSSIQAMLSATDLILGQKVSTGASVWKISTSTKGWQLNNGTQYAIPLTGVYVEDAGADPMGAVDSYPAFEFARSKFSANDKRRFTLCLGGGDYLLSQELALSGDNSYFRINGAGATITASANMDAVISWPMIASVRVNGIRFAHKTGVVITSGIIYGGKETSSSKTIRHIIRDVEAYNVPGAPVFILMKQTWESKFINIRSDHDVSGMTGTNIKLLSCVNNEFSGIEVGYSSIGIHFSKSSDVTYKCEGINFTGITTFAKTAVKGDFITALRIKGVFDFCETVAMEFTNGADVQVNAWMANTSSSSSGGSLIVSLPSFSGVKVTGSHFVNNAAVTYSAASINSPNSKIIGNTGQSCQPGFRYSGDGGPVEDWGNDFGIAQTQSNVISGISSTLWGDAGYAPLMRIRSGKPGPVSGQLLSRIELTAPDVNANNSVQIDAVQGNFGDVVSLKIGYNGTPKFNLDVVGGDLEILTAGRGIRLKSPNGGVTRLLRINDSGNIELIP